MFSYRHPKSLIFEMVHELQLLEKMEKMERYMLDRLEEFRTEGEEEKLGDGG